MKLKPVEKACVSAGKQNCPPRRTTAEVFPTCVMEGKLQASVAKTDGATPCWAEETCVDVRPARPYGLPTLSREVGRSEPRSSASGGVVAAFTADGYDFPVSFTT